MSASYVPPGSHVLKRIVIIVIHVWNAPACIVDAELSEREGGCRDGVIQVN